MYKVNRFNAVFAAGILGFALLLLIWRLLNLTKVGGGSFQHADWLINYSSGVVRRGISGEIFLGMSSVTGVSPLFLVSFVQGALVLILIAAVFVKGLSSGMPDRMILLLLSPALILFWVNDTTGAYRKEMLGLVCFLPLLIPSLQKTLALAVVATLFAIAGFFHEANLVLAPALIFAFYLRFGRAFLAAPALVLSALAMAAAGFAVVYTGLSETDAMCQRLLDAGLSEQLCHGIFPWLKDGFSNTVSAVDAIVLQQANLIVVVLLMGLLLFPGLWIGWRLLRTPAEKAAFVFGVSVIFALYPIATDWSRWLSMQVWVMTFLIMILAEARDGINEPVPRPLFALLISFNLGVGIDQIAPTPLAGLIYNVFSSLENFLT